MQQDNLTINLTIPTGWDTLDDYRLRYVFGLLAQGFPFAAGQDLLPFPLYIKGTVLAYYTLSGVLFIITHENYTRKGLFLYIFIYISVPCFSHPQAVNSCQMHIRAPHILVRKDNF